MVDNEDLAGGDPVGYQAAEAQAGSHATRLNSLRAAVLGANDGIVSTAGIVIGVAGATLVPFAILTAGIAGLTAGALSMAVGEYVSVSAQRDTEKALLDKERRELEEMPDEELAELAGLYEAKGLDREARAHEVAIQLHNHDALAAHAETELGIDPDNLTNPLTAAVSSAISFTVGLVAPAASRSCWLPTSLKMPITVVAVAAALVLTGYLSARAGGTAYLRSIMRNVDRRLARHGGHVRHRTPGRVHPRLIGGWHERRAMAGSRLATPGGCPVPGGPCPAGPAARPFRMGRRPRRALAPSPCVAGSGARAP
jgi:VIT1/CCC1 family predicted Fe2+/Mn2+ transporter